MLVVGHMYTIDKCESCKSPQHFTPYEIGDLIAYITFLSPVKKIILKFKDFSHQT